MIILYNVQYIPLLSVYGKINWHYFTLQEFSFWSARCKQRFITYLSFTYLITVCHHVQFTEFRILKETCSHNLIREVPSVYSETKFLRFAADAQHFSIINFLTID